jgi:microcystin-dependent protein
MEIQGCVLGFLCGGETWTRVAGPIPSSPANSMAKGATKTTAASPKTAAPATATAAPATATAAPKTTGSVSAAAKSPGQKQASAVQPADPVGDICLLPEIAGFAH